MLESFEKKGCVRRSMLTLSVLVAACADIPDDASPAPQALQAEAEVDAGEAAAAPQAKLVSVVATGDGCRAGTSEIVVSPDGTRAEARFPAFALAVGPDGELADTKSCELNIVARASAGFYAVFRKVRIDLEGAFDPGVTSSLSVRQTFPGAHSVAQLLNIPLTSPPEGGDLRDVSFPSEPRIQQPACNAEQGMRIQSLVTLWDQTHALRGTLRVRRIQVDLADLEVRPCGAP